MNAYPDGGTEGSDTESNTQSAQNDNEEPEATEWDLIDRDRAILTRSDREFLVGEKEVSEEAARNARYRIRERVKNGFLDMFLLQSALADDDRKQILEKLNDPESGGPGLQSTIEFIYEGVLIDSSSHEQAVDNFKKMLEFSIENVERKRNKKLAKVWFEVNREEPDLDYILKKILQGRASMSEFSAYMEMGDVQPLLKTLSEKGKGLTANVESEEIEIMSSEEVKEILNHMEDVE